MLRGRSHACSLVLRCLCMGTNTVVGGRPAPQAAAHRGPGRGTVHAWRAPELQQQRCCNPSAFSLYFTHNEHPEHCPIGFTSQPGRSCPSHPGIPQVMPCGATTGSAPTSPPSLCPCSPEPRPSRAVGSSKPFNGVRGGFGPPPPQAHLLPYLRAGGPRASLSRESDFLDGRQMCCGSSCKAASCRHRGRCLRAVTRGLPGGQVWGCVFLCCWRAGQAVLHPSGVGNGAAELWAARWAL